VVFVLGRYRVPISRQDAKELDEWIRWDNAKEARPLQIPLKDAIKNRGGAVIVPDMAHANLGYHVKDNLENKQHDLDCDGMMTLHRVHGR
jgi:hypothetical protein